MHSSQGTSLPLPSTANFKRLPEVYQSRHSNFTRVFLFALAMGLWIAGSATYLYWQNEALTMGTLKGCLIACIIAFSILVQTFVVLDTGSKALQEWFRVLYTVFIWTRHALNVC